MSFGGYSMMTFVNLIQEQQNPSTSKHQRNLRSLRHKQRLETKNEQILYGDNFLASVGSLKTNASITCFPKYSQEKQLMGMQHIVRQCDSLL